MEWQLENRNIRVRIAGKGAELLSFYHKGQQREFLWQGAAEAWSGHSLLLFPAAGRISRSRILADGREYPLAMHGFLKDMEFTCLKEEKEELILSVSWTEKTLESYPFRFFITVRFLLREDTLVQQIKIENVDKRDISFGFGAHPGFFCPIVLGESAEDYSLIFDRPQTTYKLELEEGTRLRTGTRTKWLDGERRIPLKETFFDEGPILSEGYEADWIELRSERSGIGIRMGMKDFPYMTFWGVPHQMSLICMEPWCGTSDRADTNHVWSEKEGNVTLAVGECFERSLSFRAVQ